MSRILPLKALYYPYARCTNENSLKRAILVFDELGFVDPAGAASRERLIVDDQIPQGVRELWDRVRENYPMLLEKKIIVIHDPDPVVADNDRLLAAALKADLDDPRVWKACTAPNLPVSWSILRRKIPPAAFEFLKPDGTPRVTFPTSAARKQFFDTPSTDPLPKEGAFFSQGRGFMEGEWLRYLFADPSHHPQYRNKSMEGAEFACTFPYTHGSSLSVNLAMLIADREGLIPFTDSPLHHGLLSLKHRRAVDNASATPMMSGVAPLNPEKLRRLALTLLDTMITEEAIERLTIEDAVRYREESRETFERTRGYIGELAAQIESEPWDEGFEKELQKTVHQKILPEARRATDSGRAVYEKMFGSLVKRAGAAMTPTLGVSILAGLTFPAILAVGSAAALGAALPDMIDAYVAQRESRRNALTYLLDVPV